MQSYDDVIIKQDLACIIKSTRACRYPVVVLSGCRRIQRGLNLRLRVSSNAAYQLLGILRLRVEKLVC